MAAHNSTAAIRRQKKRQYERNYKSMTVDRVFVRDPVMPENVQRFDGVPEPCFKCGTARGCKHKPWLLGQ